MKYQKISINDNRILELIEAEHHRQKSTLEMIASENFVSEAVMEAAGSVLTNKYAEGYPGNRYYGGCETVDKIEDIARDRLKKLFNCEYANVQPHSGSQANAAVYLLEPEVIQWIAQHSEVSDFSTEVLPNYLGKIATWHNTQIHRDIGTLATLQQAQLDPKPEKVWNKIDTWQQWFQKQPIHQQI